MDYEVLNSEDSPVYGIPEYDGLEYDYEVPNQMMVESPGGASSTHHHWTKGFYGVGGSSWDSFGNQPPATVYGNTGSLYATGPTATQVAAPTAPKAGTYYGSPPTGMAPQFLGNQPPPRPPPEPFNANDNIEYVAAGGDPPHPPDARKICSVGRRNSNQRKFFFFFSCGSTFGEIPYSNHDCGFRGLLLGLFGVIFSPSSLRGGRSFRGFGDLYFSIDFSFDWVALENGRVIVTESISSFLCTKKEEGKWSPFTSPEGSEPDKNRRL